MYTMDTLEGSLGYEGVPWGLKLHKDRQGPWHQRRPLSVPWILLFCGL